VAKEKGGFSVGVAAAVFYPVTNLLARRVLIGAERIPEHGPALLVMNHISHIDPLYDAVCVRDRGRVPRFLAKSTLWDVPVLKNVLVNAGQIPVYRGTANAQQSLRDAHRALDEGKVVVIYPEGTISRDPVGWPMLSRTGVARLALDHDVPLIPVARWGTRAILDGYNKKFRPVPRGTVTHRFGDPVDLAEYRRQPASNAVLREVTDLLMGRVKDLLAQTRQEPAPAGFYQPRRARAASTSDAAQGGAEATEGAATETAGEAES
jgi:1-acyl-sn-glycerol-3-phosphate acyltransferase